MSSAPCPKVSPHWTGGLACPSLLSHRPSLPSPGLGLAWDHGVRRDPASPSGLHTRHCELKEDSVCQVV